MKIDANSDGTISWDEFSTYMMFGTINGEEISKIFEDNSSQFLIPQDTNIHFFRDFIIKIEYLPKERKYVTLRLIYN
jgi:hypothetical protein